MAKVKRVSAEEFFAIAGKHVVVKKEPKTTKDKRYEDYEHNRWFELWLYNLCLFICLCVCVVCVCVCVCVCVTFTS